MSQVIRAGDIVDFVFQIAPNPSWGTENIFEAPGPDRVVTGIGIAWLINAAFLSQFPSMGLSMAISHETIRFDVPTNYKWGTPIPTDEVPSNRRVTAMCKDLNIAVHRFHSNIDLVEWGMPHAVIDQMGWTDDPQDWSRGVPVIQIKPVTLGTLAIQFRERMGIPFVRYHGDLSRTVSRVALAWGGLCQNWVGATCALPLGFDVLVGGDIIDGVTRFAREHQFAVLDAMHHATEWQAMRILGHKIAERFPGLKVVEFDNGSPWDGVV
jgi:putative NIF3 family GTP cyclohydrolase 1 type 2